MAEEQHQEAILFTLPVLTTHTPHSDGTLHSAARYTWFHPSPRCCTTTRATPLHPSPRIYALRPHTTPLLRTYRCPSHPTCPATTGRTRTMVWHGCSLDSFKRMVLAGVHRVGSQLPFYITPPSTAYLPRPSPYRPATTTTHATHLSGHTFPPGFWLDRLLSPYRTPTSLQHRDLLYRAYLPTSSATPTCAGSLVRWFTSTVPCWFCKTTAAFAARAACATAAPAAAAIHYRAPPYRTYAAPAGTWRHHLPLPATHYAPLPHRTLRAPVCTTHTTCTYAHTHHTALPYHAAHYHLTGAHVCWSLVRAFYLSCRAACRFLPAAASAVYARLIRRACLWTLPATHCPPTCRSLRLFTTWTHHRPVCWVAGYRNNRRK